MTINIMNPTQENLYISGFSVGGLKCAFSSDIEVLANSQAALTLGLTMSNNAITGVSSLSATGGVVVSQGTTVSCTGRLSMVPMPTVLGGRLYLSSGGWLNFFIMVNAGTNPFIGLG